MACRRCISSKISESDPFYDLTPTAQALYLHLNMMADDDGFLNNASGPVSRMKGGAAAMNQLVKKRFILKFGDVYVIKHWRISNSLKNDRLKPLAYASVAELIWVKPNRAYTDHPVPGGITLYQLRTGTQSESNWNPNGIQPESNWNPNLTKPNLTEPNLTEPNLTKPNLTESGNGVWEEILRIYPQDKVGNQAAAYEAFCQVVTDERIGRQMVENLGLWIQSEQWHKDDGQYVPYLVNWILRGTWTTRPKKLAVPMGASGQLGQAELEAIRRILAQPLEDDDGGQDGL